MFCDLFKNDDYIFKRNFFYFYIGNVCVIFKLFDGILGFCYNFFSCIALVKVKCGIYKEIYGIGYFFRI